MDDEREERRRRAEERRQSLVGRLVTRDEDLSPTAPTPQERLELLAAISARAWALTGQPIPQWTRETMPGRVTRRPGG
jgi:hypothetical protein